eukprot:228009-Chlamydomonas_euryale.AAC.4
MARASRGMRRVHILHPSHTNVHRISAGHGTSVAWHATQHVFAVVEDASPAAPAAAPLPAAKPRKGILGMGGKDGKEGSARGGFELRGSSFDVATVVKIKQVNASVGNVAGREEGAGRMVWQRGSGEDGVATREGG